MIMLKYSNGCQLLYLPKITSIPLIRNEYFLLTTSSRICRGFHHRLMVLHLSATHLLRLLPFKMVSVGEAVLKEHDH
jgi:hypothetical protein